MITHQAGQVSRERVLKRLQHYEETLIPIKANAPPKEDKAQAEAHAQDVKRREKIISELKEQLAGLDSAG